MFNLVIADLFKVRKLMAVKLSILFCFISATALLWMSYGVTNGVFSREISYQLSGLTEIMMISLFGPLIVGVAICQDFEDHAMQHVISLGIGRGKVLIGKVILIVFMIAVLLLPFLINTLVGVFLEINLSEEVVQSTFMKCIIDVQGQVISSTQVGKIILIYFAMIVVYVARLSICLPLAMLVKKQSIVMIIGFAVGGLIDVVVGLISNSALGKVLLDYLPYSRNYMILGLDTSTGLLLKLFIVCVLFTSIMIGITYKLFIKTEVK